MAKRLVKSLSQKAMKSDDEISMDSSNDFMSIPKTNSKGHRRRLSATTSLVEETKRDAITPQTHGRTKSMAVENLLSVKHDISGQKRFSPREPGKRINLVSSGPVQRLRSYENQPKNLTAERSSTISALPKIAVNSIPNNPKKFVKMITKSLDSARGRKSTDSMYFSSKQPVTMSLLSTLLELMGTDLESRNSILYQVECALDETDAPSCVTTMYNHQQMKILDRLVSGTQTIWDYQQRHKSATLIQSVFRTYRIRSRLLKSDKDQLKGFNLAVYGLCKVEIEYVNSLTKLEQKILLPAKERIGTGKEFLKDSDIALVFRNIPNILQIHREHIASLDEALSKWPFVGGIGKMLLDMRDKFKAYSSFIGNYQTAQDAVQRLTSEKKFLSWLAEIQFPIEKFLSYLSLPLDHLSRLEECSSKIADACIPDSDEERKCNLAHSLLYESSKFMKERLELSKERLKVLNIQRRLTGDNASVVYSGDSERRFLLESQFTSNGKKRTFLLFNDILLVGKNSKGNIKIQDRVELQVVFFGSPPTEVDTSFVLKTPYSIMKVSGRLEDVQTFINILSNHLPVRKRNPTFGHAIADILKHEGSISEIPSILSQCVTFIEDGEGISTEGLFRVPGARQEIHKLKELFDNNVEENRDLSNFCIHSICGVLKLWFRELPEPLLTFELYDTIIKLEREEKDDILEKYSELLALLPNLPTLSYLIKFLVRLCEHSKVNKMSSSNAAIVFGPTLLRPEKETMESTLNSPLVNQAIQRFIDNHEELFDD